MTGFEQQTYGVGSDGSRYIVCNDDAIRMNIVGSGCGSVGRAVVSNSRGPQLESNHQQKFIPNIYCQLY